MSVCEGTTKGLPGAIDVEKFAEVCYSFIHTKRSLIVSWKARSFEIDSMQSAMKSARLFASTYNS
jgi:hypothetical protein